MPQAFIRNRSAKHVVIVGAGPGGLASAMLLARSGVRVTLVEKHGRAGGRTATLQQDGYKFDIGPTFFLYPRVLREIFADAGYDLDREVPMKRLDPQYRLMFGSGGQIDATPDIARMEAEIARISPHDAEAFRGFLERNRRKLASFLPFLESPFESWTDLLKPGMLKLLPLLKPWLSLDGDLRTTFLRRAHPIGFQLPVEVPGHEPVPLPLPLLDSVVSGVRTRSISSDWRLRRGVFRDGAIGRGHGRRDPSE